MEKEYSEEEMNFREEMHDKILDLMADRDYKPSRYKEFRHFFDIKPEEEDMFINLLNDMEDEVSIIKTKNNRYMLPPDNVLVGTYLSTRRGFGFVRVEGYQQDFFISARDSINAFHEDNDYMSKHYWIIDSSGNLTKDNLHITNNSLINNDIDTCLDNLLRLEGQQCQ